MIQLKHASLLFLPHPFKWEGRKYKWQAGEGSKKYSKYGQIQTTEKHLSKENMDTIEENTEYLKKERGKKVYKNKD